MIMRQDSGEYCSFYKMLLVSVLIYNYIVSEQYKEEIYIHFMVYTTHFKTMHETWELFC